MPSYPTLAPNMIRSTTSAVDGETVNPSDSQDLTKGTARALWIGSAGDVSIIGAMDTTVVFKSVPAGYLLPVQVKRVNATGTTAGNIVALY